MITNNASLTSFVTPNKDVRVETVAAVNAVVTGNNLTGVYTRAKAEIPRTDNTPTIPAVVSSISQSSVYGLRLWLEAHFSNSSSPTWSIDIENFDDDSVADTTPNNGDYSTVVAAEVNNTENMGNDYINNYTELKTVNE